MTNTISQIDVFTILYPVAGYFKFFENAAGRPLGRPAVLVRITSDDGTTGWGECVPSPRWSYETIDTVISTIRLYLAPELLGRDPHDVDGCHQIMHRTIAPSFSIGQPICKAGLDLALFDLTGKLRQQTAAQRWGRHDQSSIRLSWTLNPRTPAELEDSVASAHARGYRDFNIKIAPDPAADLAVIRRVRQLAPTATIWVDANGGYDVADALAVAPRLADLGVAFFEQPVAANRLSGFAELTRQVALPIIMDEGVLSVIELAEFHRLGLLNGLAVKVARVGGLTEARRQIEYLEQHGLIFLGSGLTDPDVALAGSAALFSAYGLQHAAALNGPQYISTSVLKSPLTVQQAELPAPTGPGLGIEIDEVQLARLALT
ncbi:MAG: mandelate racemase/muconate lactonizing enzyme family protein [Planctomycetes bacterium]|nr:mandelate racemase/muconate lactonizing enzyme family protein [Planctomycetota bacterium]